MAVSRVLVKVDLFADDIVVDVFKGSQEVLDKGWQVLGGNGREAIRICPSLEKASKQSIAALNRKTPKREP